ncbi:MAG: SPFH/Band 7/PHB domain protein [Pseudomonadales bacterium]|nr:SPFH/Band 7/PHB domain protein [Pseudomonadales bacterium]
MDTALIIVAFILGLVFLTIFLGVKLVPQGTRWVVQRLGKYHTTLNPGLNLIIPYVDTVAYKVTTKDIVLEIPAQEVITKDNVTILANAVAYISIISPDKAVYGVENYRIAIQTLVQTSLRSIVGEMSLDDSLSSRDVIKAKLKEAISNDIADWGITLKTVEIQDISPSATMQGAMEEQAAAERQRRATVTKAEGDREAQVLEADGRLEASRRDAEAQVLLADASKTAITMITESLGSNDLPAQFILGEKYINSLSEIAASNNAKTIIYPADLAETMKSLLKKT